MEVPTEILIAIASRLHIKDLKNFRLVSRQCASAGLSLIPQNGLSVLDTVECIERFKALLLCSDIAKNTRKITFLYGTWPICFSRRDWARHPLLFRGNDRSNATRLHSTNDTAAEKAFEEYSKFREQELSRRYYDDVAEIFNILSCLPNLQWVDIGSVETCAWNPPHKPQLHKLAKKIWMGPKINYEVTPSLQKFLLAFNNQFQNVKTLSITGLFNTAILGSPLHCQFQSIEVLQIESFGTSQDHDIARKFLLAFPNLLELSLNIPQSP
ncbi:hypothetical protein BDZ45DRAFT_755001 [Acephala macrosclerotiorum]|nr:hypothetical protein BDZ45DRAFT_755001 [Acephala macrosclerotiorum]